MATRRRSLFWFFFLGFVALAAGAIWCVRRAGRWLVVQDQLEPAAAIVVLSGHMPERAIEAAHLYRQGAAPQVWLTRPIGPVDKLAEMGITYVSEESYNQRILVHLGVPDTHIVVLDPVVVNTTNEVDAIGRRAARESARSLIVVTTKAHTRRVRAIWLRRIGKSPRAIVRFATTDDFDPEHWWRRTRDALDVLREVFGLANAWAGFPVKPSS